MTAIRYASTSLAILAAACAGSPAVSSDFPSIPWQTSSVEDPAYRVGPGDTLDVSVPSAPELSRTVIVAPDGRIRMPLTGPIFASGQTVDEIRTSIITALTPELHDPRVDVIATGFGSQRAFIGGAVDKPGIIELPGQIDPLQAIILAGGFTDISDTRQVLLIRRMPGGEVKSALFDIRTGLQDPALAAWGPLQRFDIVYVSKTWIARENQFVRQYIRQALPIDFSIFFGIGSDDIF